jgi:hypothetical protein
MKNLEISEEEKSPNLGMRKISDSWNEQNFGIME